MGLFGKLFKRQPRKQPEDYYDITITDEYVKVEHPKRKTEQIKWKDIEEIDIITTDEGPFLPDVWLILTGKGSGCSMPQGAPNFNEIYEKISKYEDFRFEEFIKAMSSTDNARFNLWKKIK
jgi:hypothetical protein